MDKITSYIVGSSEKCSFNDLKKAFKKNLEITLAGNRASLNQLANYSDILN